MNIKRYAIDFLASGALRHGVAVSLGAFAALIAWSIFPHPSKNPATTAAKPAAVQISKSARDSADKIAAIHLFGQSSVAATIASSVTAASIDIQGLFYSPDEDLARVILEVSGTTGVFKTGDTLPDGERVKAIGLNAVQIANGTSTREIALDERFGNAGQGIQLTGMPELYAHQDPFPGDPPLAGSPAPFVQRLQPVTLPQSADPIAQMRALRQQLVSPIDPRTSSGSIPPSAARNPVPP